MADVEFVQTKNLPLSPRARVTLFPPATLMGDPFKTTRVFANVTEEETCTLDETYRLVPLISVLAPLRTVLPRFVNVVDVFE